MLRINLFAAAVAAGLLGYALTPDAPGSAVGDDRAVRVTGGVVGTASSPHGQNITGSTTVCSGSYYPDLTACSLASEATVGGTGKYALASGGVCSSKWVSVWLYCGGAKYTVCG